MNLKNIKQTQTVISIRIKLKEEKVREFYDLFDRLMDHALYHEQVEMPQGYTSLCDAVVCGICSFEEFVNTGELTLIFDSHPNNLESTLDEFCEAYIQETEDLEYRYHVSDVDVSLWI